MDQQLRDDVLSERNSLCFQTTSDAFRAMARTNDGQLISGNWKFAFEPSMYGFVGTSILDQDLKVPVCMVKGCRDYIMGAHYCKTHFEKEPLTQSPFPSGKLLITGVKEIIAAITREYGLPYGQGSLELHEKLEQKPYSKDGVRVMRQHGSNSLEFDVNGSKFFLCGHASGCYRTGLFKTGLDWFCGLHKHSPAASYSKDIRANMKTAMEMLVVRENNGALLKRGDRSQWKAFLHGVDKTPEKMQQEVAGAIYKFQLSRDKKKQNVRKLCYKTSSGKVIPVCLFPLCANRTGSSLKNATRCCKEHAHLENTIDTFLDLEEILS